MTITTGKGLAQAALEACEKKNLYVMGCFGAPMTATNKARWLQHHPYNREQSRAEKIRQASADTFGFDCICFIKGLLWGWTGDPNAVYGGAAYGSGGVPDVGTEQMIALCREVSTDFSRLSVGEFLWMPGHAGIYVGGGLAVECTPDWADGIQVTALENTGGAPGYHSRTWVRHGKLPWLTYEAPESPMPEKEVVQALQGLLILRGYSCGKGFIDGSFGPETRQALEEFCKEKGISPEPFTGEMWAALIGI